MGKDERSEANEEPEMKRFIFFFPKKHQKVLLDHSRRLERQAVGSFLEHRSLPVKNDLCVDAFLVRKKSRLDLSRRLSDVGFAWLGLATKCGLFLRPGLKFRSRMRISHEINSRNRREGRFLCIVVDAVVVVVVVVVFVAVVTLTLDDGFLTHSL